VWIDLLVQNQKPPSNESGFCFPGEKIWSDLFVSIKQRPHTSKTQFVGSHFEAFSVQALAVDLDCRFLNLRFAKGIEVLFKFLGSFFNTGGKAATLEGVALAQSFATFTTRRIDGVELYESGAILNFDVELSRIR